MVQYLLYKRRNNVTPFMVLNPDTIDSTSTSMFFVGKQTTSYGQPMEQSTLWMLENFANINQPAPAILGQEWFNANDNKMYVCTNESLQLFEKVSKPIVSATAPSASVNLQTGDLWYNTTDGRVYVYNSSQVWIAVGPLSPVPLSVEQYYWLSAVTNTNTPTQMFVNGVNGQVLTVPLGSGGNGTTWLYEVRVIGRVAESISENIGLVITGMIDNPNAGTISLVGGQHTEISNITPTLTTAAVNVSANVSNNSLQVTVTGQNGKTILWNAVVRTTVVSN